MLNDIVLQVSVEGRWRWHLEPNRDYIVVGVYRTLTSMESVAREDANDINFVKSFSISKKKNIYLFGDYYATRSLQRIIQLSEELVKIMLICALVKKK